MTIQISIAELRSRGETLFANWEKDKQEIKINAKQLYRVIKLKAIIEEELRKAQAAINVIAEQNGGELQPEAVIKSRQIKFLLLMLSLQIQQRK